MRSLRGDGRVFGSPRLGRVLGVWLKREGKEWGVVVGRWVKGETNGPGVFACFVFAFVEIVGAHFASCEIAGCGIGLLVNFE